LRAFPDGRVLGNLYPQAGGGDVQNSALPSALGEHHLHFGAQVLIVSAGSGEKRVARGGLALKGRLVELIDLPPAGRGHDSFLVRH
jgi:hypothetical protein